MNEGVNALGIGEVEKFRIRKFLSEESSSSLEIKLSVGGGRRCCPDESKVQKTMFGFWNLWFWIPIVSVFHLNLHLERNALRH